MNKKFLHSSLSLKKIENSGIFSGYASVFNIIDKHNDIILPGAFQKSLSKNKIKLLWQHDPTEPIGIINNIHENEIGLHIVAQLLLSIQKAKDVYLMLKTEMIDGLSIGYIPTEYEIDYKTGTRFLKEVELWEISLVTFPSNLAAQVVNVKNHKNEKEILIEAVQRANTSLNSL